MMRKPDGMEQAPSNGATLAAVSSALLTGFAVLAGSTPAFAQSQPPGSPDRPSVAPKAMQAVAPTLAEYTDDVLFGDVWLRPDLSPRDRSMVTLSMLIATGKSAQLTGHLGRALQNGVKPVEIAGIVTHLAFYTGWPNAVSSLDVIEKVFTERKIDMTALRSSVTAARPAQAPDTRGARTQSGTIAPKLAELTDDVVFGDLWRRGDLTPRDRSLVTIAALAAAGDDDQLAVHIRRAWENGLTRAQIGEAFTHLAFYAGLPKAIAAVGVANATLGEGESDTGTAPLQLYPPGVSPTKGPASNFAGVTTVTSPFKATGTAVGGATVSFKQGAHTNWHRHPKGQLLVITDGLGTGSRGAGATGKGRRRRVDSTRRQPLARRYPDERHDACRAQ